MNINLSPPTVRSSASISGFLVSLIFPIVFIGLGCVFFVTFLGDFSWKDPSIARWVILDTSHSPRSSFEYNGITYTIESKSSSSCNGWPCSHAGDKTWILVDGTSPSHSIYLSDLLFLLIFPLIGIVVGLISFFSWRKTLESEKQIVEIKTFWQSVSTIVVDVDRVYHRNSRDGYKYICRDPRTLLEYESSEVVENTVALGSTVQVYTYPEKYPWISYVDLDTAVAPATLPNSIKGWSAMLSDASLASIISYQQSQAESFARAYKQNLNPNNTLSPLATIFLFLFLIVIFSAMAIFFSGMLWIFVVFFLYFLYGTIRNMIREKKKQNYAATGIVSVGTIKSIQKYGYKMIPLGYIPPEEAWTFDLEAIQSWENVELSANMGYSYYFLIDFGGREIQSEKFAMPFPQKAKIGAKIEILFRDPSMQDYVVDMGSIERLNEFSS